MGATFHELLLLTKRGWQCAVRNMQPLQSLSEITLRADEVDKNAWRTSFCSLSVCENGFHFQLTTNCLNIFLLNITSVSHQEISYTLNIAESCAFDIIKRLVFKFKVVQSNRILSLGRKWHQYDAGMPCQIVKLHGTAWYSMIFYGHDGPGMHWFDTISICIIQSPKTEDADSPIF